MDGDNDTDDCYNPRWYKKVFVPLVKNTIARCKRAQETVTPERAIEIARKVEPGAIYFINSHREDWAELVEEIRGI